ncbi:hypothetical protein OC846_001450 [Tilletia horrida]|uniref:alpha-galactosidase n=1 Tax=Tilletia horrida TaxID=155126 RepID=A0AAN6GYU9_9BASI|nr:hypothetical protein OC846_001450 [Tilletia horrida]KAK0569022.1 hypothetical protein OC861_001363 [Tilletia horrida]
MRPSQQKPVDSPKDVESCSINEKSVEIGHGTRSRTPRWAGLIAGLLSIVLLIAGGLHLRNDLRKMEQQGYKDAFSPSASRSSPISKRAVPTSNITLNSQWQIDLIQTLTVRNGQVTPNRTSTPSVTVYDIDMFNHQNLTVVRDLQKLGLTVICYFSSGSYEPGRPDSYKFKKSDKGNELDGWPGEYWLNLSSSNVRSIMANRIAIAANMGCNAIDPDNVDGYDNDNGLGLTKKDSISFVRFLAAEAAKYGMQTGLKNAAAIISGVLDVVAFSVNEECVQYQECDTFAAFPQAGKPVFNIEYPFGDRNTGDKPFSSALVSKYCDKSSSGNGGKGFNSVLKDIDLDGFVQYCNGKSYITKGQ